ncbi:GNAT family N-acetyltransferase [Odoribacter sp. OttesenSCG-928-J03]|nr:GNAT family N-acetyltransferase [Odoribacter sp. OttesenSCG-928-J03]MDL2282987.1 GNAT family N-acetyltransferase [Odoribacter sp. OttesenSCG-928-G04]
MDLIIRRARLTDIDAILEVEKRCFGEDRFSKQQLTYLATKSKGIFYLCKYQGEVVAYISLLSHKNRNNLRIYSIAVSPEVQGKGIGKMLFEKAVQYAVKKRLWMINIEVRTNNEATIGFCLKNGFKNAGLKKEYYSDGADAYMMHFYPLL